MTEFAFGDEIKRDPVDLPRAALCFAREIAYPALDLSQSLAILDQLAAWAGEVIPTDRPAILRGRDLAHFLFIRFGFRGNAQAYEDPRNSYLNEVLDRRLGIPISLSVVFMALAQRLDLQAYGVGLPGHFIVAIQDPLGVAYFDPFHEGRQLTVEDCAQLVQATAGLGDPFQPEWLRPTAPLDILARMLNNLRNTYLKQESWPQLLAVVERLRLLQPELASHLRDLGLIHHQMGFLRQAVGYYEQYLRLAPDAPDRAAIRANLQTVTAQIARMN
jgi:regulator of sirC expression with transglutaminase-like and TPR domain